MSTLQQLIQSKAPIRTAWVALAIAITLALLVPVAESAEPDSRIADTRYLSMKMQGLDIAYREAGDPTKQTIVLLHGFPTSSHMFRELIPQLAEKYHVVAPDYPGSGASAMPASDQFDYSFADLANVVHEFLQKKGIATYALYVMDYGAPVGFRLFAKHPTRVSGFHLEFIAERIHAFLTRIQANGSMARR